MPKDIRGILPEEYWAELPIKQFDPIETWRPTTGDMRDNYKSMLVIGGSGTGKSFFIADQMYYIQKVGTCDKGVVYCPTEAVNGNYGRLLPPMVLHKTLDPDHLNKVLQANENKMVSSAYKPNTRDGTLIIMDDVQDSAKTWKNHEATKTLFMRGRHAHTPVIYGIQEAIADVPPWLRQQIKIVVLLFNNRAIDREKLYKNYASVIPSYGLFNHLMNQITVNRGALILDNTKMSMNFLDCVFWYRATTHEPFRFGTSDFWNYADRKQLGKLKAIETPIKEKHYDDDEGESLSDEYI